MCERSEVSGQHPSDLKMPKYPGQNTTEMRRIVCSTHQDSSVCLLVHWQQRVGRDSTHPEWPCCLASREEKEREVLVSIYLCSQTCLRLYQSKGFTTMVVICSTGGRVRVFLLGALALWGCWVVEIGADKSFKYSRLFSVDTDHDDEQTTGGAAILLAAGERTLGDWCEKGIFAKLNGTSLWVIVAERDTDKAALVQDLRLRAFVVEQGASWATVLRRFRDQVT